MPSKNFPGPSIDRLIESDPQIIKVPMENMGWGARASAMPKGDEKPNQSNMTLSHVKSEK
jgi:hypothetical protein